MIELADRELEDLLAGLAKYHNDPLGFVINAFPWGEGELIRASGPEEWQSDILGLIRDGLSPDRAVAIAVASGHGIGKSTLIAWIILWSLSTETDTRCVVTANTESQLRTKTWPELAKWYRLCIARPLFKLEATSLLSMDADHTKTWRADMIPWSERNPEAFAGLHNQGRRVVMLYDEGSAIPDIIYETSEGFMSDADTERLWLVFGNPTRSIGRFRECFAGGRHASAWISRQIDSRTVSFTNKDRLQELEDAYGADSDYFRVRVKGEFPRVGAVEFIAASLVAEARMRETESHRFDPLIIGVDVARFGDDETVIVVRKGRDARSIPAVRLRGLDTMQVASRVVEMATHLRADGVFIDEGGVGGGVVDRCRQLRLFVLGVQFGGKSDRHDLVTQGERYANKRAEIWGSLRAWMSVGAIEDNDDLRDQLIGPSYGFNARDEIQLERKEDMRRRGIPSPDWADALAITFAYQVVPNEMAGGEYDPQPVYITEYNPFESAGLMARVTVAALARALEVIMLTNRTKPNLCIVAKWADA